MISLVARQLVGQIAQISRSPTPEERHREASPDILKGSRLIWVSASTNREERNDRVREMEVKTEVAEEGGSSRAEWQPCRRLMSRKIMF